MANPIQTIDNYLPGIPVQMRVDMLMPMVQAGEDSGAHMSMERWFRPCQIFDIEIPLKEEEMDLFFGFVHYHKCDRPFWFNGGEFGNVQNKMLCAYGNGVQKDFFAPNRYVTGASVQAFVDGGSTTVEAVRENSGMIRLSVAPASNAEVTANYQCKILCVFELQGTQLCELSPRILQGATSTPTSDTKSLWDVKFRLREIAQHWNF